MEQHERQIIDELFTKLRQAEQQAGPRDADAERHIQALLAQQPAAPYYMSQAILVQEQALNALNQRVQELERQLAQRPAASGGGFLSGLFGGGSQPQPATQPASQRPMPNPAQGGWGNTPPPVGRGWSGAPQPGMGMAPGMAGGGGGFLASAAATAMGVAGGVMLANALTGLFGGEEAHAAPAPAAEPSPEPVPEAPASEAQLFDDGMMMDDGGDFGGFEEF